MRARFSIGKPPEVTGKPTTTITTALPPTAVSNESSLKSVPLPTNPENSTTSQLQLPVENSGSNVSPTELIDEQEHLVEKQDHLLQQGNPSLDPFMTFLDAIAGFFRPLFFPAGRKQLTHRLADI